MVEIRKINAKINIGILDLKAFALEHKLLQKREIEKAGTSYLLKHLLNFEEILLDYTAEKKPFLKGRTEHVSISHSHDKLAIIINQKEHTGIDIELIRDKVLNIKEKFLNPNELVSAGNNVDKVLTYWAAKETLFKIIGRKDIEFIANIQVDACEEKEFEGRIISSDLNKRFLLRQETIDNYKLVYALHEIR